MYRLLLILIFSCCFLVFSLSAEDKINCQNKASPQVLDPQLQKMTKSVENITNHFKKNPVNILNGCVSMSFDDGYEAVYSHAFPILKKFGMVGTAYITTGVTDKEGYMSWGQLKELENLGWEIGAHTDTHPELEKISLKDAKKEAFTSLDKLKAHGLKATGFAFPYGSYTQADVAALSTRFVELRGFWDRDELNDPTSMNANLVQVKGVVKETTIDEIKSWLDQAKKENRCLALVFHDFTDKNTYTGSPHHIRDEKGDVPENYDFTYYDQNLNSALQAIKDSGLPVVTESQMVKMPGVMVLDGAITGKKAEWTLKSGAVIDHNVHGSFPNSRDSVKIDSAKENAGTELLSKTINLRKLPKVGGTERKMVFEAYFNALEMKTGSVEIEVQELSDKGVVLHTVELSDFDKPGEALRIRHTYTPTDANVAKIRLMMRPQDLKGKVFISNPVLNEY